MLRLVALMVVFVVVCLPAWGSELGQPLDCSDWVLSEPGLTCTVYSDAPSRIWNEGKGTSVVTDPAGRLLTLRFTFTEAFLGDPHRTLGRTEIVRKDGEQEEVIAYIEDRFAAGIRDQIRPVYFYDWTNFRGEPPAQNGYLIEPIVFDAMNGRLLLFVRTYCNDCAGAYDTSFSVVAIDGFATLFEILQTYTPVSGPLSFNVPYAPEGFQYADYFDTYYGDLTTVGDWSQAQGLQCGYPATAPTVGDYLAVDDTLPTPTSGQGYYYVTAVNYQGQRRYGRQSSGGVLTGRDPAVLPVCN